MKNDLYGQVFHDLTVVEWTGEKNNQGRRLYRCLCKCGNIVYATTANLRDGEIKSCKACRYARQRVDITGKRYGKLTAVSFAEMRDGKSMWLCKCECGNEKIYAYGDIVAGKCTTCGCMQGKRFEALYVDNTEPIMLNKDKKIQSNNKSGHTGVWFDKSRDDWLAYITFKRVRYMLGRFRDKDDAITARKAAEQVTHEAFLEWYEEHKTDLDNAPPSPGGSELETLARKRKQT